MPDRKRTRRSSGGVRIVGPRFGLGCECERLRAKLAEELKIYSLDPALGTPLQSLPVLSGKRDPGAPKMQRPPPTTAEFKRRSATCSADAGQLLYI